MGSSHAGEMCMESGGRAAARRGKKPAVAAGEKAAKQPQRGLGVAQLEKIRLHNQMLAAYRSGAALHTPPPPPQVHFAAPVSGAGASSLQPYLADLFEATGHRRVIGAQYYENLLPNSSGQPPATRQSPPPPPGRKLGQFHWMSSSHESGGRSSTEELDLELRL